jgi:hypothetical protein
MKVYNVLHTYPPGPGPTNTCFALPTLEKALAYQAQHGGRIEIEEIDEDDEWARRLRGLWDRKQPLWQGDTT